MIGHLLTHWQLGVCIEFEFGNSEVEFGIFRKFGFNFTDRIRFRNGNFRIRIRYRIEFGIRWIPNSPNSFFFFWPSHFFQETCSKTVGIHAETCSKTVGITNQKQKPVQSKCRKYKTIPGNNTKQLQSKSESLCKFQSKQLQSKPVQTIPAITVQTSPNSSGFLWRDDI